MFDLIPQDREARIQLLEEILKEKKQIELAKFFKVNRCSVCNWRKSGIPFYRIQTLMLKFPKLKAWDLLKDK